MSNASFQMLELYAEVAQALAHPVRLRLLNQMSQCERPVERLAQLCEQSIANTSQHLQHLKRGGFVKCRREGKRVFYDLADGPILELIAAIRGFAEHNQAAVRQLVSDYYTRLDALEPLSRTEVVDRLKQGDVTILDLRAEDEFAMGHLPGAINISIDDLERRLDELPAGREIVAYCRGSHCILSYEAVALLRSKGYAARRLEDGLPEWRRAGLKIETSAHGPH